MAEENILKTTLTALTPSNIESLASGSHLTIRTEINSCASDETYEFNSVSNFGCQNEENQEKALSKWDNILGKVKSLGGCTTSLGHKHYFSKLISISPFVIIKISTPVLLFTLTHMALITSRNIRITESYDQELRRNISYGKL